ncbi:MAG: hypothetical protein WD069_10485 [Planctomycetales bacterium]
MERDRTRRRNRGGFIGIALAVLPLLYVLSSGPMLGLALRYDSTPDGDRIERVATLYRPLIWIREETPHGEWIASYWAACFEKLGVAAVVPIYSDDPDERARQLIFVTPELAHIPELWERTWGLELPPPDQMELEAVSDPEVRPETPESECGAADAEPDDERPIFASQGLRSIPEIWERLWSDPDVPDLATPHRTKGGAI